MFYIKNECNCNKNLFEVLIKDCNIYNLNLKLNLSNNEKQKKETRQVGLKFKGIHQL